MLLPLKPICERKNMRRDGTSIIFIQYCYSTQNRTNLNTEIAIPPAYWNKKQLTIKENLPADFGDVDALKVLLKQKIRYAEDLVEFAVKNKIANKAKFVKEAFESAILIEELERDENKVKELAGEKEPVNLDVYFQIDEYINTKKNKVSKSTVGVYENMKQHLKSFQAFKGKPIAFDSFDFNFYDSFVDFLTFDYVQPRFKNTTVGLRLNTIGKTIKQLKIFIKDRVRRKIIAPIDLTDYKVPDEETDAIYLTYEEISTFYHTDLSMYPELTPYRDLFVLACLTGLRFSDFSTLRPEDLRNDLLHKRQEKSDHKVVIPLKDEAKMIFTQQFKDSIPRISNVDFNENIKTIGKLAGINQPIKFFYKKGNKDIEVIKAKCDWITSHTARRSFCTNEFLAGTPVKLIMMISGHKKEKDFYRYIRISPEEAAEVIKKLWMERNGMQAFERPIRKAS